MRVLIPIALLLVIATLSAPAQADVHPVKLDVDPFFCKWDSVQDVLLCLNDPENAETAGAAVYDIDGNQRLRLFPLKDFPWAKRLHVWDLAAMPDGGVVLAGMIVVGEKNVRHVTLLYGSQGQLLKVWNILPYYQHAVAADRTGNVYGLGERLDIGAGPNAADYPLIEKYSTEGKVLAEFMPRKTFESDVNAVTPQTGLNRIEIVGGDLVVLLAPVKEVLWFDAEGKQERRISLRKVLHDIGAAYGDSPIELQSFVVLPGGGYLTQLRVWPKTHAGSEVPTLLVQISNDGQSFEVIKTAHNAQRLGLLRGVTREGKYVFLRGTGANMALSADDGYR